MTGETFSNKLITKSINARLTERMNVNMPEGWNKKDVLDVQECLNELLKPDPVQQQIKQLETFINGKK